MAVERDHELVGHFVSDGIASAATPQHSSSLEEPQAHGQQQAHRHIEAQGARYSEANQG